jgi:hypothetical protein
MSTNITQLDPRQIEKLTAVTIALLIENGAIGAALLAAGQGTNAISNAELKFLSGVTSGIQAQLNARFLASNFKGAADANWSSDLIAVSAAAIAAKIGAEIAAAQIGGVMAYKGAWSQVPSTIPLTSIKAGWTFTYDSGSAITGHTLEAGDQITAKVDNPSFATAANWTVVQANISGAVTSIETAVTDSQMVVYSGATGKIIKKLALTGLLKVVNGVPSVATASDLPSHTHTTQVGVDQSLAGTFTDTINFQYSGCTITWNDSTKELLISVPTTAKTDWKFNQSLTGLQNGSNRIYTIAEAIVAGSDSLIYNGLMLTRGLDYTISGTTITLSSELFAPETRHTLKVNYIKA